MNSELWDVDYNYGDVLSFEENIVKKNDSCYTPFFYKKKKK